ncbi:Hypothetical predicted protein [Olea europaea subsp. europaea]|uniref:Uncharacterized protein n=1 Tax=Olea europaea subsp. europaea TaxID=158383 RepID=A0A8S0PDP9_OLEEU|nr:Hypothetical predicted protein [Olea europaea subsp. europaea]
MGIRGASKAPQFNALGDSNRDSGHAAREDSDEETSEGGSSEEQTSSGDEKKGTLGSDPDGEDIEDTDVYGGLAEPCLDEQDIPIDTGNMQDATHIEPCQDDVNLPVAATTEEVQDVGATEPSNTAGDDDDEAEGYNVMDGDGVVTEVSAPGSVPKARAEVPTTRRCSALLRRSAVATRTPYTGGGRRERRSKCYKLAGEHDNGLVLIFGW